MTNLIAKSSLNILKRIRYASSNYLRYLSRKKNLLKISRTQDLLSDTDGYEYSEDISIRYPWFSINNLNCLQAFQVITDSELGGASRAQLYYNKNDNSMRVIGDIIEERKMLQHPFIRVSESWPMNLTLGPFNAIQVQLKSDGLPLEIEITVTTRNAGYTIGYGILVSNHTDWRVYELPFLNMMMRGLENIKIDQHNYMNDSMQDTSVFKREFNMRRFMDSELNLYETLNVSDFTIRLMHSQSCHRDISIRNVYFLRRSGGKVFRKQYLQPYYFLSDPNEQIVKKQKNGIQFLKTGYGDLAIIDIGHRKYIKKEIKQKKVENSRNQ